MRAKWFVDVWRYDGGSVAKTLGPFRSEHVAARAAGGVNRNLDHGRFFTKMREGA